MIIVIQSNSGWLCNRQYLVIGGKSGLHTAKCQVTPGRRKPTASATEIIPP